MSANCLGVAQFLQQTGTDFSTFGVQSTGTIEVASVGAPGDTLTIGGVVLTAVAGARTSGSNDFSLASGTALGVAQSIVEAITDAANGFTALVTAAIQIPGVPTVMLTSVATGYYSTLPIATSDALVYVLSGSQLEGGDLLIEDILASTCSMLGDCWGNKKSYAHLYLTAHFLTVAAGGESGPVSSRKIDRIAESYATATPTDPELGSTKWGRLYLALRATVVNIGAVVGRGTPVGFVVGGGCGC